jgi:predicted aspartyl protease
MQIKSGLMGILAVIFSAFAIDPAKTCDVTKKAELPLGYSSGLVTVEVRVNGAKATFGLDTGAQTVVTPQASLDLGLKRDWRRSLAKGTTTSMMVNHAMIEDLEFGGDHHAWMSVPEIALPTQKSPEYPPAKATAGLIGMDILGDYDFDLDFEHRKLTLYSVRGCGEFVPEGFKNARSIPFRFSNQRNIMLKVDLDGVELNAMFDTGSTLYMITPGGARKLGVTETELRLDPSFQVSGAGNVSLAHALHKFNNLTVAGMVVPNVSAGVLNRPLVQGEFLLGQPLWLNRRVWISAAARTLFIEDHLFNPEAGRREIARRPAKPFSCDGYSYMPAGFCRTAPASAPSEDTQLPPQIDAAPSLTSH